MDARSIAFGLTTCHHEAKVFRELEFLEGEEVATTSDPSD